jgi:type I restriction enzyme M protein
MITKNGNGSGSGSVSEVRFKQVFADFQESSMALQEPVAGLFEILKEARVMGGAK